MNQWGSFTPNFPLKLWL